MLNYLSFISCEIMLKFFVVLFSFTVHKIIEEEILKPLLQLKIKNDTDKLYKVGCVSMLAKCTCFAYFEIIRRKINRIECTQKSLNFLNSSLFHAVECTRIKVCELGTTIM